MITFQEMLRRLNNFWEEKGCIIQQPYDLEKGAGTLNPSTFLRCLGPEPYNAAYVEPCRRPTDGRYGENPNRVQHYFQYQVILKPSPPDIQTVYIESLKAIGINLEEHDIRFVHDDWENPTIGAAGLGWEAWIDGMEVTQITYFQVCGGIPVKPVTGELTYGLERLAMYIQNVDNIFDLQWNKHYTYGDIYKRSEIEWSGYNFEHANVAMWSQNFDSFEKEAQNLIEKKLPLPAYDFVMKASHAFNILDARGAISVTERTGYISRIRNLAKGVAVAYVESREEQGFPLLKKLPQSSSKKVSNAPPEISKASEDYLLEIGSEELPASFVPIGLKNLENLFKKLLQENSLNYSSIETYATPRRLTLLVKDLATVKQATSKERKGPPIERIFDGDSVTKAGSGFFNSLGIETAPSLADIKSGKATGLTLKNEYLFAEEKTAAIPTAEILAKALPALIENIQFPKKMHWSNFDELYARPIVWIVSLYGTAVVPFSFANVTASNITHGHRQLCHKTKALSSPSEYLETLRNLDVIACIEERKSAISEQLRAIENELNAKILHEERVMKEVLYLVEKPLLTHTEFDREFLKAPKELLVSEMIEHQKYFPLETSSGELLNAFVITANNTPSELIKNGNRKVLSARLSDGVFLYSQDLKISLDQMNEKLKLITYQKELGSMWTKVGRLQKICKILLKYIDASERDTCRAATLCKADLASHAVFEFTDLQGVMGKHYALAAGETKSVATAIEEHWMPLGENASLPETICGIILSIADKLDNLAGCFAIGLKPTSSSDPHALRRQVLGIIKILIKHKIHLPLKQVLEQVFALFNTEDSDLMSFIRQRVKTVFLDYGFSKDLIEASLSGEVNDIYDMYLRAEALEQFRRNDEEGFASLYEVFKRAKGQLGKIKTTTINKVLLSEPAEISLHKSFEEMESSLKDQINAKDYSAAFMSVAKIQPPLAKLFEEVQILDDSKEIRENRLALLQGVFGQIEKLIDFSKIKKA